MRKGKFIAFYGINNLGKTTQAKDFVEHLKSQAVLAEYIKYARYDLQPTGPILNDYLRNGNPHDLNSREFQIIQAHNRLHFEPELKRKLDLGIHVIAEDYIGTSIAWGTGAGIDQDFLINLNSHLIQPDLCLLFHGDRFLSGIETGHKHENDDELTNRVAKIHDELGERFGWQRVYANQTIENVKIDVLHYILSHIEITKSKDLADLEDVQTC